MAQKGGQSDVVRKETSPKDAITAALVELMEEKPLDKITITELVQRAGVGRSSFYRHFSNKEDVLLYHINTIFGSPNQYDPKSDAKVSDYLLARFRKVRENREFFEALDRNDMLRLLYQQLVVNIQINMETFHIKRSTYQPIFFTSAETGVLIEWIKNGFPESEEELTQEFMDMLYGNVEW